MWKRPKKRFRELRKLGISEAQITMVVSSRGRPQGDWLAGTAGNAAKRNGNAHWNRSRTLATNTEMGNE